MENALKIKNLSKGFKGFQLNKVNLTLPYGCIMGLIGENGAGKSTIIKLIFDLIHKDDGEIEILGRSSKEQDIRDDVSVVMEENGFSEYLNAKQVNSVLRKIYSRWDEKRFFQLLDNFSIPKDKIIKDLSKGMRMKLSIAAALSHNAKLLILDEATSGLDPVVRDEILDIFLEFIQDETHSILLSSHITGDLEKVCDYITFIHQGNIVFSQEKDRIFETYGIMKFTQSEFENACAFGENKAAVIGSRKNKFGVEALVDLKSFYGNYEVERPTLDDIMVYFYKQ